MACICRSVPSLVRPTLARVARPSSTFSFRSFASSPSTSASGPTDNADLASPSSAPAPPNSACPAGTVLKGLNYVKDGTDPVAKEESEYPPWVWTLLNPGAKEQQGENDEVANLRKQKKELKRASKAAIKAANALKG
ncbi:hypothetical protein JCM21900_001994 [Sporobolomyces salmonicolor]